MIPFSGFMQANTGLAIAAGDKTVSMGKNANGQSNYDMANLPSSDDAGSFPEWVRTLMTGAAILQTDDTSLQTDGFSLQTDSEGAFNDDENQLERLTPDFDHLQAMINDAGEQPTSQPIAALDMMIRERNDGKQLEQQVIDVDGVDHFGSRASDLNHTPKVLAAVQKMMAAGKNGSEAGQLRTAAIEPANQAQFPDQQALVNPAEQGIKKSSDRQIKGNPLPTGIIEKPSADPVEKDAPPSVVKSEAPVVEKAKSEINRVVQTHPVSGQERPEKASEPAATPKDPISGPAKPPMAMETALTDHQSASYEDGAASYRDTANYRPAQRSEFAPLDENENHKAQSFDPLKNTGAEVNRPQAAFQESAKATMVDRSSADHTATMARTEEPAARSFQTAVMDQIVDKASLRSVQGRSEIQIRLKPDFLGNVQMNIATDKEQLVVRVLTDQPVVKEIIETNLHQLKSELQSQGLTIDKFDVMVNPDADHQHSREQFAQMFKNSSFQNGRRQNHEQETETPERDDGNKSKDDQPDGDGVNYFA